MIVDDIYCWAQLDPRKPAMVHNGRPLGYGSFARAIEATRNFLEGARLAPGRTALVLGSDLCDAWVLTLALRSLGLDTVSAGDSGQAAQWELRDVVCVVATEAGAKLDRPDLWSGTRRIVIPASVYAGLETDPLPAPRGGRTFGGHILLTSGTTGSYKKLLLSGTHERQRNARRAAGMSFHRDSVHHGFDFALWSGSGFKQPSAIWSVGGTIVLDQRNDRLARLFEWGVDSAAPLPPMMREILRLHGGDAMPGGRGRDVELGVSSGFLPLDIAEATLARLTRRLKIRYSATELMSIPMESLFRTAEDLYWLTPEPGRKIEIVDEDGRLCPPEVEGDIRIALTEIDCGSYLHDPEATDRVFGDGFFYPGDRAVARADGRIRILGRAADVINVQGTKVAVAPIEQEVQRALSVDEVCIFTGLNREGQEELVIVVETDREPPRPVLASVSRRFVNLPGVRFVFIRQFPRTEAGTRKVKRSLLRQAVFAASPHARTTQDSPVLARRTFAPAAPNPCRVVIFGISNPKWMAALSPEAPVWSGMPNVAEVLTLADAPGASIPEPTTREMQTVVIPLTERHTKFRPRGERALVPDDRALAIFANKLRFAEFARQAGLARHCPETYTSAAAARFPCVLKRTDLHSGAGVAIVRTAGELETRLHDGIWRDRPVMLQQYVDGATEYVTHCVCRGGRILWHRTFAYDKERAEDIRNLDLVDHVRPCEAPAAHLDIFSKFLLPLGYTGPCNFDYKLAADGTPVIFEINPRLGGSLMLPENVTYLREALSCIVEHAA